MTSFVDGRVDGEQSEAKTGITKWQQETRQSAYALCAYVKMGGQAVKAPLGAEKRCVKHGKHHWVRSNGVHMCDRCTH